MKMLKYMTRARNFYVKRLGLGKYIFNITFLTHTNLWMTSYAEQRAYWKGFLATAPVPARAKLVYSDLGESKNIVARGKWTIVLYAICYMLSSKKSHDSFLTRYIKIWLLHFIITFRDQLKVQRTNSLREGFFFTELGIQVEHIWM